MVFLSRPLLLLAAATLTVVPSVLAQTVTSFSTRTTSATSTRTSSQPPATITVKVGLQHDFQPDVIRAKKGDVIHFDFFPKNHSVVQAAFKNPCIPSNLVSPGSDMFFSGKMESQTGQTPPSWELTVNDTQPTFFYCSAPRSCIDWSMIGVINPNGTHNLDIQKEYQKLVTFQLSPGEAFPDESPPPVNPNDPSATPTPTAIASDSGSSSGLSAGAIAGIAVGGAAVLIGAIALIYVCGRKGGIEKGYRRSTVAPTTPAPMIEANYPDGYGPAKSPIPPNSPYGAQSETWRSSVTPSHTPSHFSPNLASPHNSFMAQPGYRPQQAYGFPAQHTGQSAELNAPYDAPYTPPPQAPPAELAGNPYTRPR